MNARKILNILLIALLVLTPVACNKQKANSETQKYVEIYDLVKESFLTDKGFSDEISKHMTKEVFDRTNIYNAYPVNSPEYKKPFKVDFNLKEISQKKTGTSVIVEMTYSVVIADSDNKTVGGSKDVPVYFTVKLDGNEWIIIDKEEQA